MTLHNQSSYDHKRYLALDENDQKTQEKSQHFWEACRKIFPKKMLVQLLCKF